MDRVASLLAFTAFARPGPILAMGPAGVVVEQVARASAGEKAGLQAGDLILSWSRPPAPPANPAAAEGAIESPFDLSGVELEQLPRGTVTLAGRREQTAMTWTLNPAPMGLTVRPFLPDALLAAYQETYRRFDPACPRGRRRSAQRKERRATAGGWKGQAKRTGGAGNPSASAGPPDSRRGRRVGPSGGDSAPSVVLVGEMRDSETVETALRIAETGHLTFATLHTNSAVSTITRIVDIFPGGQQDQIRAQLGAVLEGIVCQALLPRRDGKGRVLVMEILIPNAGIRSQIRENKVHQIYSMMQTGRAESGMQTLNNALGDAYQSGRIALDVALSASSMPDELQGIIDRSPKGRPGKPARP